MDHIQHSKLCYFPSVQQIIKEIHKDPLQLELWKLLDQFSNFPSLLNLYHFFFEAIFQSSERQYELLAVFKNVFDKDSFTMEHAGFSQLLKDLIKLFQIEPVFAHDLCLILIKNCLSVITTQPTKKTFETFVKNLDDFTELLELSLQHKSLFELYADFFSQCLFHPDHSSLFSQLASKNENIENIKSNYTASFLTWCTQTKKYWLFPLFLSFYQKQNSTNILQLQDFFLFFSHLILNSESPEKVQLSFELLKSVSDALKISRNEKLFGFIKEEYLPFFLSEPQKESFDALSILVQWEGSLFEKKVLNFMEISFQHSKLSENFLIQLCQYYSQCQRMNEWIELHLELKQFPLLTRNYMLKVLECLEQLLPSIKKKIFDSLSAKILENDLKKETKVSNDIKIALIMLRLLVRSDYELDMESELAKWLEKKVKKLQKKPTKQSPALIFTLFQLLMIFPSFPLSYLPTPKELSSTSLVNFCLGFDLCCSRMQSLPDSIVKEWYDWALSLEIKNETAQWTGQLDDLNSDNYILFICKQFLSYMPNFSFFTLELKSLWLKVFEKIIIGSLSNDLLFSLTLEYLQNSSIYFTIDLSECFINFLDQLRAQKEEINWKKAFELFKRVPIDYFPKQKAKEIFELFVSYLLENKKTASTEFYIVVLEWISKYLKFIKLPSSSILFQLETFEYISEKYQQKEMKLDTWLALYSKNKNIISSLEQLPIKKLFWPVIYFHLKSRKTFEPLIFLEKALKKMFKSKSNENNLLICDLYRLYCQQTKTRVHWKYFCDFINENDSSYSYYLNIKLQLEMENDQKSHIEVFECFIKNDLQLNHEWFAQWLKLSEQEQIFSLFQLIYTDLRVVKSFQVFTFLLQNLSLKSQKEFKQQIMKCFQYFSKQFFIQNRSYQLEFLQLTAEWVRNSHHGKWLTLSFNQLSDLTDLISHFIDSIKEDLNWFYENQIPEIILQIIDFILLKVSTKEKGSVGFLLVQLLKLLKQLIIKHTTFAISDSTQLENQLKQIQRTLQKFQLPFLMEKSRKHFIPFLAFLINQLHTFQPSLWQSLVFTLLKGMKERDRECLMVGWLDHSSKALFKQLVIQWKLQQPHS